MPTSSRASLAAMRRLCGTAAISALGLAMLPSLAHAANVRSDVTGSPQAVPINIVSDTGQTTRILNPGVISWVHFGDLHIQTSDMQNYVDFKAIINNTNQYLLNGVNFAVLPGDNANEGSETEYQLIRTATSSSKIPIYAIPGDHDHHGYESYAKYMEAQPYYSFSAAGYHFAFLDVMSGISDAEKSWLTHDLDAARTAGLKSVLFAHTYNVAADFQDLIGRDGVVMIDAGHTHVNNVANDGHTIYAATRSTGQISEGPVGFSIVNLDNGVVSWKFKPLGSWPFVMITSPADKGLIVDAKQIVRGPATIRAKVWDDKGVALATMQIDGGTAVNMQRIGATQMWSAPYDFSKVTPGDHKIRVNVRGAGGNTSSDTIDVATLASNAPAAVATRAFGPSGNSLGVYTEKGLLGNTGGPGGGRGAGGPGRGPGAPCAANVPPLPNQPGQGSGVATAPTPGCGGPGGGRGRKGRGQPPPPPDGRPAAPPPDAAAPAPRQEGQQP